MKKLLCFLAACAAYGQPGVPQVSGPIPVTATSHPLLAADHNLQPLDLAKLGYVEEEFIVAGGANVYDWATDGTVKRRFVSAPYATRILVRRPADAAKFNGSVVVELPNEARRFDWPMLWGYVHNYVTDSGAAWVLISMPGGIQSLKKFDESRYGALAFNNPSPPEACPQGANQDPSMEDGLRWDVISQVAAALKNGNISGLKAQRVYLTAQGGDMITYINAIQPEAKIYDGFVVKSPGAAARIRRCSPTMAADDKRHQIHNAGVPVIGVLGQGEVVDARPYLRSDSDEPGDRFRVYEIAGAAHIDSAPYPGLPSFADQTKTGSTPQGTPSWPFNVRCEPEIPLEVHPLMSYIFDSAFSNLDLWLTKGTPAPKGGRIELKEGQVALDRYGNGVGGVRSPDVDIPVARFFPNTPGPGTCRELGHEEHFDWARLEELYGNYKNYAAKVNQEVDRMVKERWLTEGDARRMKAQLTGGGGQ